MATLTSESERDPIMSHTVAFRVPHLLLDLGQVTHFQVEDDVLPVGSLRAVEDVERLCQRLGRLFHAINLCGHEVTWLLVAQEGPAPPVTFFSMDPAELSAERSESWPDAGAWFTGADVVALRIDPRRLLSQRGPAWVNVAAVALAAAGLSAKCRFVADQATDGVTGGWLIAPVDDTAFAHACTWLLGRLEAAVAAALVQLKTKPPELPRVWLEFLNGGGTPPPIGLLWALDPDLVPSLPAACRPVARLVRDQLFVEGGGLAARLFMLLESTRTLLVAKYAALERAEGAPDEQAFKVGDGLAIIAERVWQDSAFPAGAPGRRDRGHLHSLFAMHERGAADLFASVELAAKFYSDWMGKFWNAFPGGSDLEITGAINAAIGAMAEGAELLKAAGYRNASRATVAGIIGCESEWDPQARNPDTCSTCVQLKADVKKYKTVTSKLALRAHWDASHTDRAGGMTQFLGSTWLDMNENKPQCSLAKYTKSHGITAKADILALRFDVRLAVLMGVELALYRSMSNATYAAAVKKYFGVTNLGDLSSLDLLHAVYYAHHEGPGDAPKVLGLLADGLESTERYGSNFEANWNNNIDGVDNRTKRLTDVGLKAEHFSTKDQKDYAKIGADIAAGKATVGAQNAFFSDPKRTVGEGADAAKLRFNYAYALWLKSYVVDRGEPWLTRADQFNPIPPKDP